MSYSETARALRRCRATCRDGHPCPHYATWDDLLGRCATHGGRTQRKKRDAWGRWRSVPPSCICIAYPFPHRPGSGFCQWPEFPEVAWVFPAGTRREDMWSGDYSLRLEDQIAALAREYVAIHGARAALSRAISDSRPSVSARTPSCAGSSGGLSRSITVVPSATPHGDPSRAMRDTNRHAQPDQPPRPPAPAGYADTSARRVSVALPLAASRSHPRGR
jgi:hypothetical protein